MQVLKFKQWFKTRALHNAHAHYYNTAAEVKSNQIIDDMFNRLDADGGGSLDCSEITALFKENGIHMSQEQVANMFGEAQREDNVARFRKTVQGGLYSRSDPRCIQSMNTEYNMKMQMDPQSWKVVTKSPAALKSKYFVDQSCSL